MPMGNPNRFPPRAATSDNVRYVKFRVEKAPEKQRFLCSGSSRETGMRTLKTAAGNGPLSLAVVGDFFEDAQAAEPFVAARHEFVGRDL